MANQPIRRAIAIAAGLWGAFALASMDTAAIAQTEFRLLGEPVLTLRNPAGETATRAELVEQRFKAIVESGPIDDLEVSTRGNAEAAQLLLNGAVLVDVTLEDAAANATGKAIALAEVWAERLQTILDRPEVRQQILATANMPAQLVVGGRRYVRQSEPAPDLGRFVTDGTRVQNRVIFWMSSTRERRLPQPIPSEIYLLDGFRQFIPYRAS
ncbi:hypothetical protein [Synechococcus sp. PCC 7336]|uniref:hypothetical protein n=1 Tax=Synechococcus sp. PCC 7336 TaxID=195250 RepID=UPI0012E9ACA0|nr:hypothetical protein [Synechococcus sp. PCC 7336]